MIDSNFFQIFFLNVNLGKIKITFVCPLRVWQSHGRLGGTRQRRIRYCKSLKVIL